MEGPDSSLRILDHVSNRQNLSMKIIRKKEFAPRDGILDKKKQECYSRSIHVFQVNPWKVRALLVFTEQDRSPKIISYLVKRMLCTFEPQIRNCRYVITVHNTRNPNRSSQRHDYEFIYQVCINLSSFLHIQPKYIGIQATRNNGVELRHGTCICFLSNLMRLRPKPHWLKLNRQDSDSQNIFHLAARQGGRLSILTSTDKLM